MLFISQIVTAASTQWIERKKKRKIIEKNNSVRRFKNEPVIVAGKKLVKR